MKEKLMKLFYDLMKFGKVETAEGVLIYESDTIEVGTEVFIENEDGDIVAAPDGEYGNYVVVDGVIAEIKKDEVAPIEEPAEEKVEEEEEQPEEEVTPDPKDEKIAELENQLAEKDAKIAELEAKIAEMEAKEEEAFKQMKPAEKEIKNIATKTAGAMKYFNN